MDKTPTRMSKLSLLHRAPHGPHDPTRIYPSERVPKYAVQTRRDYPTGLHPIPSRTVYPFVSYEIILKKKGTASERKPTTKKVALPSGFQSRLVVLTVILSRSCCFVFHPFSTIWIPTLLRRRKNPSRKYGSAFACGQLNGNVSLKLLHPVCKIGAGNNIKPCIEIGYNYAPVKFEKRNIRRLGSLHFFFFFKR